MKRMLFIIIFACLICTIEQISNSNALEPSYKVKQEQTEAQKKLQKTRTDINQKIQEDIKKIDEKKLLKFVLIMTEFRKP